MKLNRNTKPIKNSRGAILLVSLLLLLVMTLIGIGAIDNSLLQGNMARNSFESRSLYQRALSEIEAQYQKMQALPYLEKAEEMTSVIGGDISGMNIVDSQTQTYDPSDSITQNAELKHLGNGPPPSGFSVELYIGKNYEIDSTAEIAGTGSLSSQTQGLTYPAPRGDD